MHATQDARAASNGTRAEFTLITPEGAEQVLSIDAWPALVGKANQCALPISGWRAAKEHARLTRENDGVWLEDLGSMTGTSVNGSRVVRHGPLHFADEINIAGYRIRLTDQAEPSTDTRHGQLSSPKPVGATAHSVESATNGLAKAAASQQLASRLLLPTSDRTDNATVVTTAEDMVLYEWRQRIHELMLETIDLRRRDLVRMSDAELRIESESLIRDIVAKQSKEIPPSVDRSLLIDAVLHEAVGLGPLEDLLGDPSITEIMVNRYNEVFVERRGRLTRHGVSFTSDRAVMGIIERIVSPLGRRIDESSPMVDARLKDGSRVNAVIPPLAIKGPTITIRKFSVRKLQPEDLVTFESTSEAMIEFLKICVEHRKNIVVSGGTGSGKTTFLNMLSNFIPNGERIVTVEDAAELQLNHSHLVSLEARPSNAEGRGAVAIRDLVRNCLRMRPDRIVVGECRGGEALDMLQAMNTGHEGSMTTLHANAPRDAVARLETMILMAGMDLPLAAVREQIASAVDIIVQQTRFPCGSRKVTSITEVCGMENGRIQLMELFKFERTGRDREGRVTGKFKPCGIIPSFFDELRDEGVKFDLSGFQAEAT